MRPAVGRPFAAAIAAIIFLIGVRLGFGDLGIGVAIGALADPLASAIVAALLTAFLATGAALAFLQQVAARFVFLAGLARRNQAPGKMPLAVVALARPLIAAVQPLVPLRLVDRLAGIAVAIGAPLRVGGRHHQCRGEREARANSAELFRQ